MSLKKKLTKGVFWSGVDKFSSIILKFIITFTLARILSPSDFGLIGLLAIFIGVSQVIVDSGFGQAIIREKNITDIDLSSVFYVNVIMGCLIYVVLFFLAPSIAAFYNEESLVHISRILFLIIPLGAFGIIQYSIFTRSVDFKTLSIISIISIIVSGTFSIAIALKYKTIWSIVFQQLSLIGTKTILYWVFSNWKLRLIFSVQSIKKFLAFSSNLLFIGIIGSIFNNMISVLIGKMYSSKELGFYNQADQLQKLPSTNLTAIILSVMYPVLSRIQDDEQKLRRSYLKIIGLSFFVVFPIMIFLFIVCYDLFGLLLTDKWEKSFLYFRILCFAGALYPITNISFYFLKINGKGKLMLRMELVRQVFLITVLLIFYQKGVVWLTYSFLIYSIFQCLFNSYFGTREVKLTLWDQFKYISPTFLTALMSGIITYYTFNIYNVSNIYLKLISQANMFFIGYLSLSKFLNKKDFDEIFNLFKAKILR